MQFLILFYLLCFLIFLFSLYELGKEDTLFIRKSVSMEQLFNVAFLTAGVSILSARVGFVLMHWDAKYANPFTLLWPNLFNELSFIVGVVGSVVGLFLLCRYKRLPFPRIFDFLLLSLISCLPLGIFATFLLSPGSDYMLGGTLTFLCLVFSLFFFRLLYPRLLQGNLKDGNIGILVVLSVSLLLLFNNIVVSVERSVNIATVENGIVVIVCILFFGLLVRQELFANKKPIKTTPL